MNKPTVGEEPLIFTNEQFGQVRAVQLNSKEYFIGKDIANALGYKNPRDAISRHCKGVVKHDSFKESGQRIALITEGDMYRLITNSELPNAEKFENWVFDYVLPSIRKTGMYATDELLDNPDLLIAAVTKLKEERSKNKVLEEEKKINAPKVLFAEAVSTSHTSILVGELAKLIKQNGVDIGQGRLFKWLRDNGYLIRRKGTDYNMPTQKSMELEIMEIKERAIVNPDGTTRITKTPKVTGKGQQYFVNKFLGGE